MSSEDVDDIDKPTGKTAKLLVAQANSSVDDSPFGPRELTRQVPDTFGGDAGDVGHPIG